MSRMVSVGTTEELDGSEGAETVTFELDGVRYEIDLGEANQARLESSVAPFVAAGRRVSRGNRRQTSSRAAGPSVDRAAVRASARGAGLNVSVRGRPSAESMRPYSGGP